MLDLSPDKIFVLAIVALVVLGPHRLPQAARTLGRLMGQLRALTSSVQDEVRDALHEPHEAFTSALTDFRPSEIRRNVRQTVMDTIAPPESAPPGAVPSAGAPAEASPAAPQTGVPARGGHPDDPSLN
ncbi:MAG TPA: twin-arginine translocase TatA/TatE family subunit [Acidimicrobiales bacterium]|nr:twin-arginine translocase TatA/TatE family subunit [Acidimicrobiales bacterium]